MPSLSLTDFSSGIWLPGEPAPTTEQPGFEAPPNALLRADNIDYGANGSVRGRRGSSKFNSVALAGDIVAISKLYFPPSIDERRSSASPSAAITASNMPRSGGDADWVGLPGGIQGADGVSAQVTIPAGGDTSNYLYFQPFLGIFNPVPGDATIIRVEVRVLRSAFAVPPLGAIRDSSVQLTVDGLVTTGSDKADTGTDWTSSATQAPSETKVYCPSGDGDPLWGLALTPQIVNSFKFGFCISVTAPSASGVAQIDFIELTVFFTTALTAKFVVANTDGAGTVTYRTAAAGTFTAITGGAVADSGNLPKIIAWSEKQKLFIFDGENDLLQYDGMEITAVPTAPDVAGALPPRRGPYAALHKGRLYATEPSEIGGSVYACEVNDETLWLPDAHLNVSDSDGGALTGIESFGDLLIILKDTGLHSFQGDPVGGGTLIQYSDEGCVAPDSVANSEFGVIYVARHSVRITDGQTSTDLSFPIRSLFVSRATETVYPNAKGVYYPRRQQYWLKLDPTADEGWILSRVRIPTQDGETTVLAWHHMPVMPFNVGFALPGAGDDGELYLGDRDGFLWLRDTGAQDDGAEYDSIIRTRQAQFASDTRQLGRVSTIRAMARINRSFDVALWYDQNLAASATYTLGALGGDPAASPDYREPRQFIPTFDVFGRFISAEVTGHGGPDFELQRLDLDFMLRTRRVWR